MDGSRFDDLARSFADRASRRAFLRGLIGSAVLTVGGGAGLRGRGSRAEERSATPTLPTAAPFDPAVTETATAVPTEVPATGVLSTATPTPSTVPTATATPTREARGTPTPTARPTVKGGAPVVTATPTMSLSPVEGRVGSSVRATIAGFPAGDRIELRFYTGSTFRVVRTVSASSSGKASVSFTVPTTTGGDHRVRAQGSSSRVDAYFRIQRSTTISPTSGLRGTVVTVQLRGYRANLPHQVLFYSFDTRTGTPLVLASVVTSSTGSANTTITIPNNALFTKHRIEGKETNGSAYAGTFFTVLQPACTPNGISCAGNPGCCSGYCDLVTDRCACKPISVACAAADQCCTETCTGGTCACRAVGTTCTAGKQCCSGACVNGKCTCRAYNQTCNDDAECCSGSCDAGVCECVKDADCSAQHFCTSGICFCLPPGSICGVENFCCTGDCSGPNDTCCRPAGSACTNEQACCSKFCIFNSSFDQVCG